MPWATTSISLRSSTAQHVDGNLSASHFATDSARDFLSAVATAAAACAHTCVHHYSTYLVAIPPSLAITHINTQGNWGHN